jgi:type VI protein secretion system component Hcp
MLLWAWMTVTLPNGTRIDGGGDRGDTGGAIPLFEWSIGLTAGFSVVGQPGIRTIEPFCVQKAPDEASPRLWEALATGRALNLSIACFEPDGRGVEVQRLTIDLEGVVLTRIDYQLGDANQETETFSHERDVERMYRSRAARRERRAYDVGMDPSFIPARENHLARLTRAREIIHGTATTLTRTYRDQGTASHRARVGTGGS